MAQWVRGWKCDGCKAFVGEHWQPRPCAGCKKEICDNCGWSFGHCNACAGQRTDRDLAIAANATGDYEFDLEIIL
jgi:hypothetical protein